MPTGMLWYLQGECQTYDHFHVFELRAIHHKYLLRKIFSSFFKTIRCCFPIQLKLTYSYMILNLSPWQQWKFQIFYKNFWGPSH